MLLLIVLFFQTVVVQSLVRQLQHQTHLGPVSVGSPFSLKS